MSKQSKQAKKKIIAQQITKVHLGGGRGPARTTPLHNKDRSKRWCHNRAEWYSRNNPDARKRGNQFIGM